MSLLREDTKRETTSPGNYRGLELYHLEAEFTFLAAKGPIE